MNIQIKIKTRIINNNKIVITNINTQRNTNQQEEHQACKRCMFQARQNLAGRPGPESEA